MKSIRNLVFETNSSSTHSLTIRRLSEDIKDIPRNVELNICKEIPFISNQAIVSEMDKLRYMVSLVALLMDYESDRDYFGVEAYSYWGPKAAEGWKKYKNQILEFPWLVWLCEVVKEERNTTLVFENTFSNFPYISETDCFEDEYVWEVLGLATKEIYEKDRVKELFRDLIFNPNIILEDLVEEH